MGTSFVAIGDRGFWMRDAVLELWLRLLALHVEDSVRPGMVATTIRDQWLLVSRGGFNGCIQDGLEESVSSEEGMRVVRQALASLMGALGRAPPELDRATLNLMGFDWESTTNFETKKLLEVGQAFIDLLDGKITSDASSTAFMPGCR